MNVQLTAGLYYALSVHWTANSGYYWLVESTDDVNTFGSMVNGLSYNSSSPPSGSPSLGVVHNKYAMTVTTRAEECFSDSFEAGQFSQAWTLAGDADWFVQTTSANDGTYSAKSGPITHSQETSMQAATVVPAGAEICFDLFGNSQYQADYLKVYLNSTLLLNLSGLWNPWGRHCATAPQTGTQLLFEFSKNNMISVGADAFWVDDIVVTP